MPRNSKYTAFRLCFDTPVRFGSGRSASGLDSSSMTADSDQFFAAVCQEWVSLYGASSLKELISTIIDEKLVFSGLFPWKQTFCLSNQKEESHEQVCYYLPRPLIRGKHSAVEGTQIKKTLRKISWIEASRLHQYLDFMKTGEGELGSFRDNFGTEVVWDRVNTRTGMDNQLYRVSAWKFDKKLPWNDPAVKRCATPFRQTVSGLYWIVKSADEDMLFQLSEVVGSLGVSGIGGKVSSGLGKFTLVLEEFEQTESGKKLISYLNDSDAPVQMTLGSVIPEEKDFETCQDDNSSYLLVERNGFTSSTAFCDKETGNPLKRKTCILIRSGSCFPRKLSGTVADLSYGGIHPVYRIGKALHVGLRV